MPRITEDWVDHLKNISSFREQFMAYSDWPLYTFVWKQYNVYMSVFHYKIFDLKHSINNIGIAFR